MAIALTIFTLACGFTYLVTFAGPSDLGPKAGEQALRFGDQLVSDHRRSSNRASPPGTVALD